jgi:hypothetical protein
MSAGTGVVTSRRGPDIDNSITHRRKVTR